MMLGKNLKIMRNLILIIALFISAIGYNQPDNYMFSGVDFYDEIQIPPGNSSPPIINSNKPLVKIFESTSIQELADLINKFGQRPEIEIIDVNYAIMFTTHPREYDMSSSKFRSVIVLYKIVPVKKITK